MFPILMNQNKEQNSYSRKNRALPCDYGWLAGEAAENKRRLLPKTFADTCSYIAQLDVDGNRSRMGVRFFQIKP